MCADGHKPLAGLNSAVTAVLLDSGSYTHPGTRYGDLNQDYVKMLAAFSEDDLRERDGLQQCHIAAVLDGHGMLGEKAAEAAGVAAVAAAVASTVAHQSRSLGLEEEAAAAEAAVHRAFEVGHAAALELYKDPPPKYRYPCGRKVEEYTLMRVGGLPMYGGVGPQPRLLEFGATCTLAMLLGSRLAIGNAGDSAAVLGRRLPDGALQGEELTVRHWGQNPTERERIVAEHGSCVDIGSDDGYLSVASGRWRGYQLSMTRALGHNVLADFGVIASPSVVLRQLDPGECCLIVASDGVWDVFGANESVRTVMECIDAGGSAAAAAEELVQQAVGRALDGPDGDSDNATAAVMVFSVEAAAGSAGGSTHGATEAQHAAEASQSP